MCGLGFAPSSGLSFVCAILPPEESLIFPYDAPIWSSTYSATAHFERSSRHFRSLSASSKTLRCLTSSKTLRSVAGTLDFSPRFCNVG